ncbi:MAG: Mur ligase family protein [Candidatus Sungbacteria bacterium]|nr:Mur ligase family protein [bacterium]MDZ4260678.1 Mur ligase family protein [Candidatus Sungbacteria bacterium]
MKSDKSQQIHIIGIGGIGVSALARYYRTKGHYVTGSDLQSSEITQGMSREGVSIVIGKHKAINIPATAVLIIYTAAVPHTNPELKEARKRGLNVMTYAQAVGELTTHYKTITISGSHGKSTTTALAGLVLEQGYYDPTVIVGTKINEFGASNFRNGRSGYLVLEADEWNKSFLHYHPEIAVVTNIDAEHLDTYGTVEEVEKTFQEYLEKVPRYGKIIANEDDERLRDIAKKFGMKVKWYSLKSPEAAIARKILQIPGEHNVSNALAALTLGRHLGIAETDILAALKRFTGAWRRFEFKGIVNGALVYSDYGHHPSEIQATLLAARERFPFRRVFCVYQPHQYQRLQYLWDKFVGAFDRADNILLLPVYDVAGRETGAAKQAVNSKKLARELTARGKQVQHVATLASAKKWVKTNAKNGDVFLIMGAGDIYTLANEFSQ